MTHLQAFARYTDGTARVIATERDDPTGRRELDKAAGEHLHRPDVSRVEVIRVARVATASTRRSYR